MRSDVAGGGDEERGRDLGADTSQRERVRCARYREPLEPEV